MFNTTTKDWAVFGKSVNRPVSRRFHLRKNVTYCTCRILFEDPTYVTFVRDTFGTFGNKPYRLVWLQPTLTVSLSRSAPHNCRRKLSGRVRHARACTTLPPPIADEKTRIVLQGCQMSFYDCCQRHWNVVFTRSQPSFLYTRLCIPAFIMSYIKIPLKDRCTCHVTCDISDAYHDICVTSLTYVTLC